MFVFSFQKNFFKFQTQINHEQSKKDYRSLASTQISSNHFHTLVAYRRFPQYVIRESLYKQSKKKY